MKSLKLSMLAMVCFVAAVLTIPKAASAQEDANCSGPLAPGTYHNVNALAGCQTGSGVLITGNLTVVQGGTLFDNGSTINGNLQAQQALWITIQGISAGNPGEILGSIQVGGTTGAPPGANNELCNLHVGGDVQVHNNSASSPFVIGGPAQPDGGCGGGPLVVSGNLTVFNNAGTIYMDPSGTGSANMISGNIQVHNNTGGGSLLDNHADGDCQLYNDRPPFLVGGNTAGKNNGCTNPD